MPGGDRGGLEAGDVSLLMRRLVPALVFVLDCPRARGEIALARAGGFGTLHVVERFLRIPLPTAPVPALRSPGL